MFICEECCRNCEHFDKCVPLLLALKSFGPCEMCGERAGCTDCRGYIPAKEATVAARKRE